MLAALPPDAERHAGNLVALHRRLDPVVQLTEQRVGRSVSRDRCVRRALRARQPRDGRQRARSRRHKASPGQHKTPPHLPHSVVEDTASRIGEEARLGLIGALGQGQALMTIDVGDQQSRLWDLRQTEIALASGVAGSCVGLDIMTLRRGPTLS